MSPERRKRKFINSWAQVSIAIEVVLHSLLLLALISLLLFAPPFVTWLSRYSVTDHQVVARDLWEMNISKWPLFLCVALFIGVVSVLFSHHIVGPAYKFQRALSRLNDRNLEAPLRLRKWDYLVEVQEELNRHVGRLREDLTAIQAHLAELGRKCEGIKGKLPPETFAEIENDLLALSEVLKRYRGLTPAD